MGHPWDAITQHLAARVCGQAAPRDEARGARRLSRNQGVEGVYRLDEGALLEDGFPCVRELGGLEVMEGVRGTARQRERGPVVQSLWRDGAKPLVGLARLQALPAVLVSDDALMPLGGVQAQQLRRGVGQRGAAPRPGPTPWCGCSGGTRRSGATAPSGPGLRQGSVAPR